MLQRRAKRFGGRSVPFRDRNPVVIGAIGLAVIVALLLLAFNMSDLPLLAG
jgi:phospholipid/cholesterol/gamma-HCH transport system substrate-binding protein